jgi:hypothetical protein
MKILKVVCPRCEKVLILRKIEKTTFVEDEESPPFHLYNELADKLLCPYSFNGGDEHPPTQTPPR